MTSAREETTERVATIEELGEPTSVHPPANWLRYTDLLSDPERVVPWGLTLLFVFVGVVLLQQYFSGAWGRGGSALAIPIGGAVSLLLAVSSAAFGWRAIGKPLKIVPRATYRLYPEGLVTDSGAGTSVLLLWEDVDELLAPAATGTPLFRLIARDKRQIDISQSVEDWGQLIQSVIARVTAEKLPAAVEALNAGETVVFRNFGIRRDGLNHKDKTIDWPEVTSMVVATGRGAGTLTVRQKGALFPWCNISLNELPNTELITQLLVRTAPPRLLKEEKS